MKALISDLDGTLLPHNGQFTPETLASLKEGEEKGITRIIATGRSLFATHKVLPEDFPIDYLIFSSGAGILDWKTKQLLFTRGLKQVETVDIARYLWNYNINFTIQQEIPHNHFFYYTDFYPVHPDFKHRLETYAAFGTKIERLSDIKTGATQFIFIIDPQKLHLIEKIRKELNKYSIVRSTSPIDNHAVWIEIFPAFVNKGQSALHLLSCLQIHPQECAGIGNDYNDVDFLDICGASYLVENAPHRIKPHYKTVASVQNNGFSEFFKLLF